MPVVPTYTPSGATRGYRNEIRVRADARTFGLGEAQAVDNIGAGLQQVGGALAQNEQEEQDRKDADDARRAFVGYSDKARVALHDPEQGILSRRGRNARGAAQEAQTRLDELGDEYASGLETPGARDAFNRLVSGARRSALDGVARHEAQELEVSETEGMKAAVEATINDAAASYTDPAAVRDQLRRADILVRSVGVPQGWSTEQMEAARAEARSQIHEAVLERMLADDPASAKAYLEENRENILGTKLAALDKAVSDGDLEQRSQEAASAIFAEHVPIDPVYDQVTAEQADAALRAARNVSPDIRDETVRRVKNQLAEADAVRERQIADDVDSAWKQVMAGGGIDDIGRLEWSRLSGAEQKSIKDYVDKRSRQETIETDWNRYDELSRMSVDDPDAFVALPLAAEAGRIAEKDLRVLFNLQRSRGDRSAQAAIKLEEDRQSRTHTMWLLDNELAAARINPKPGKDETTKRARVAQIRSQVWREVDKFQQDKGGRATDEEVRSIIGTLLTPMQVDRVGPFNRDIVLADALAPGFTGELIIRYEDLRPEDIAAMERVLRENQQPVTKNNVVKTFEAISMGVRN